jgi:hypothetical protein
MYRSKPFDYSNLLQQYSGVNESIIENCVLEVSYSGDITEENVIRCIEDKLEDFTKLLPYETLMKIALKTPDRDMAGFCATSQQFNDICKDDYFWHLRTLQNFNVGNILPNKYGGWREYYIYLATRFLNKIIEYMPKKDWSAKKLIKNPAVTINFILEHKKYRWPLHKLYDNPNATLDIIIKDISRKKLSSRNFKDCSMVPVNNEMPYAFFENMPEHTRWNVGTLYGMSVITEDELRDLARVLSTFKPKYKHAYKRMHSGGKLYNENRASLASLNYIWTFLSMNPSFDMQFIEDHPEYDWDIFGVSLNPNLTVDFAREYQDDICWYLASSNPAITAKDMLENEDLPWNIRGAVYNPNLNEELLTTWKNKFDHYKERYRGEHDTLNNMFREIAKNPNISIKFINAFIDGEYWRHKMMAKSPNFTPDDWITFRYNCYILETRRSFAINMLNSVEEHQNFSIEWLIQHRNLWEKRHHMFLISENPNITLKDVQKYKKFINMEQLSANALGRRVPKPFYLDVLNDNYKKEISKHDKKKIEILQNTVLAYITMPRKEKFPSIKDLM